jgi:hypothetical protein
MKILLGDRRVNGTTILKWTLKAVLEDGVCIQVSGTFDLY